MIKFFYKFPFILNNHIKSKKNQYTVIYVLINDSINSLRRYLELSLYWGTLNELN